MGYDFETAVNRSKQGSLKWKQMQAQIPDLEPDIIPFSVADTDLPHPPELIDGLKDYLDEMVLGYT